MAFLHPEQHREGPVFTIKLCWLWIRWDDWFGIGEWPPKVGVVPEHHTDFIFSVIGEELGVIASLGVVLAFMAIVVRVYIAWNARDRFGMILGTGITFLIGFRRSLISGW